MADERDDLDAELRQRERDRHHQHRRNLAEIAAEQYFKESTSLRVAPFVADEIELPGWEKLLRDWSNTEHELHFPVRGPLDIEHALAAYKDCAYEIGVAMGKAALQSEQPL